MSKHSERIRRHVACVRAIFPDCVHPASDAEGMYRRLRTMERTMHAIAEQYCNGDITTEEIEDAERATMESLRHLLGSTNARVLRINTDPKGYALKVDDEWLRTNEPSLNIARDWGGYGILAPDFSE